jgi:hypothetical protein
MAGADKGAVLVASVKVLRGGLYVVFTLFKQGIIGVYPRVQYQAPVLPRSQHLSRLSPLSLLFWLSRRQAPPY